MAKQCGEYKFTGTMDNLCFYAMEGNYYVRRKSSISRKRVKSDPDFKNTMVYANLLGTASKIASSVYADLPKKLKIKGLYKQLTGNAIRLIKIGKSYEDVFILLRDSFRADMEGSGNERRAIEHNIENVIFANNVIAKAFTQPGFIFNKNKSTYKVSNMFMFMDDQN